MENLFYEYFRDKDDKMIINLADASYVAPHFHRNLEIHYFFSDNTRVRVGDECFVADADDIVFVHNYQPHSLEGNHRKCFIIIPPYYSDDLDKSLSKKTLPPHLTDKEFNRTLLPFISALIDGQDMPSLVKKGYLDIIIGSLRAHYPSRKVEKPESLELILKILRYIDEHSREPLTLESLSSEFGYNKYYFSRLFNRNIGVNLSGYLGFVRLRVFTQLKKDNPKEKISKLASLSGFESLQTFYRTFSTVYGCSPKKYFESK